MKNYSFEETSLIVADREITGFTDEDDNIQMRRLVDSFDFTIGNKGEMVVFTRADRVGEIIVKLQQTHEDNEFFSLLIAAAENGAFVPVPVLYKDNLGNDLITGAKGFLTRPADAIRGNPVQTQEWRIIVERLDMLHGAGLNV